MFVLNDRDPFAARRQFLRRRRAAGAAADNEYVVVHELPRFGFGALPAYQKGMEGEADATRQPEPSPNPVAQFFLNRDNPGKQPTGIR